MNPAETAPMGSRKGRLLLEAAIVFAAFLLLLAATGFKYYWITDFLVFCILVLSFDLLYGYLGLLSFGHMLYYGTGAYVAALWLQHSGNDPLLALLMAVGVTAVLSAVVGWISVQTSGAAFALLTMAFNELGFFAAQSALSRYTKGDDGLMASPGKVLGLLRLGKDEHAFIFVLLVFMIAFFLLRLLTRSPFGILIRSIKENETRVRFLGYDTQLYKWVTFVIASSLAALAGGLFVLVQGFVSPRAISTLSNVEVIFAVLIGGAGSLYGALVGGVAFMLIKNFLPAAIAGMEKVVGHSLPQWELWLGLILLLIVFGFRKGLAGFAAEKAKALSRSGRSGKGAR
jgi:branched-chain amino acid transport system permease protein